MNRLSVATIQNALGATLLVAAIGKTGHFDSAFSEVSSIIGSDLISLVLLSTLIASEFVVGIATILNVCEKTTPILLATLYGLFLAFAVYLRVVDPTGLLHPSCSCIGIGVIDDRRRFADVLLVRNLLFFGCAVVSARAKFVNMLGVAEKD